MVADQQGDWEPFDFGMWSSDGELTIVTIATRADGEKLLAVLAEMGEVRAATDLADQLRCR